VLIVQSNEHKVDMPTARTEPLLDRGFRDTVARIIVAPKADNK
jgi:hypothetical protein